ncbi:UNVERIFIED_CONTAM: hypothetical protein GTU68_009056, partial [Idotea baltica]|nr:hypothetical protein [Idotea baltica]
MGDPDFVGVAQEDLLSDEFTQALYSDITDVATTQDFESISKKSIINESYETTHFSIIDKEGNAISVTTTLNGNYGSFVVVEGGGFLMNNEMDDFSSKPGVPNQYGLIGSTKNSIEGGKRMLSSMTPTIILKNGK